MYGSLLQAMALSTVIGRAVVLVYLNVNGSLRAFLNTTLSPQVEATPKHAHIFRDTVHVMWSALSEQPLGDASFVWLNHFVSLKRCVFNYAFQEKRRRGGLENCGTPEVKETSFHRT